MKGFIILHLLYGHDVHIRISDISSYAEPGSCYAMVGKDTRCSHVIIHSGITTDTYIVKELPTEIDKLIIAGK